MAWWKGLVAAAGAVVVAATLVLGGFGACSIDSRGLASGDGGSSSDATSAGDASTTDSGPSADSSADAPLPDGPTSCAPTETDCLNGIDDDCNGLTDCADPACTAGYACVPAASNGWTGYALYLDTQSAACPASYPTQTDTFEGLLFAPATCSSCACSAQGASCGGATVTCGGIATCTGNGGGVGVGESCTSFDGGLGVGPFGGCAAPAPPATPGSCTPDGGAPTTNAVALSKLSRTCAPTEGPGGGCGANNVCVAKAPAATHGACVSQPIAGTALCPAAYPHAHVTLPSATSFSDTRGCSACTCTGPNGAACSGTLTLSTSDCSDAGAGGSTASLAMVGTCQGVAPGSYASGAIDASVTSQGTCAASGGQPNGTVVGMNETAYCCQN